MSRDRIRSELLGPVEPVSPGGRAILLHRLKISEVRVVSLPAGPIGLGRLATVVLEGIPCAVALERLIAIPFAPRALCGGLEDGT
jgi:hypothetical protein